jgi:hypothetical protein
MTRLGKQGEFDPAIGCKRTVAALSDSALHLLIGGAKMTTVVIPDAANISALGSVLVPILRALKVPDGQMTEFSFIVSLKGRKMILHKGTRKRLPKTVAATKH